MEVNALVLIFLSASIAFPARGGSAGVCRDPKNGGLQFTALGTVHKYHLEKGYHYSLYDLTQAITAAKPDLICGEVAPEAYKSDLRGYFPPEQRVVEELAKRIQATYIPSDWRSSAPDFVRVPKDPVTDQKLKEMQATSVREIQEAGAEEFAFRHSEKHQREVKAFHDLVIRSDGEGADGYWITRNKKIVQRCLDAVSRNHAKRVLFVFGGDHNYIIQDILKSMKCTLVDVPKVDHSSQQKLDLIVVPLWEADRERLEKALQSDDLSLTNRIQGIGFLGEIRGADRLHDLDLFIQSQQGSPPIKADAAPRASQ
jgi:hypothetical protein